MVKYFHFHAPNKDWDAQLSSLQCRAANKDGSRCKRRVVIGLPLCFQHTSSVYHLKIKTSTISNAGLGLFAYDTTKADGAVIFKDGDKICPYFGEVIDNEELEHRYGEYTAPYGIQIKRNLYEDTAAQRGIGSLINHKIRSRSNCKFSVYRDNISIKATKNIRNNQELFINYGAEYQFNEAGVHTSTNARKR